MKMTFVSWKLNQSIRACNFRSARMSSLRHPFANRCLTLAITVALALQLPVVHAPLLQTPFSTFDRQPRQWAIVLRMLLTIDPKSKVTRWLPRRGQFGAMS